MLLLCSTGGGACRLVMLVMLWGIDTKPGPLTELTLSPGIVLFSVVIVRLYVAANVVIKPSNIVRVRISCEKAS